MCSGFSLLWLDKLVTHLILRRLALQCPAFFAILLFTPLKIDYLLLKKADVSGECSLIAPWSLTNYLNKPQIAKYGGSMLAF